MVRFPLKINFIYLILLTKLASSIDITDLTVTCDIRNASVVDLANLPDLCTAGATSTNFEEIVDMLTASKSSKPFIYLFSGLNYDEWIDRLNSVYAEQILQYMKNKKLDGIAFDNLYYNGSSTDQTLSNNISEFLQLLKSEMPNAVFGLTLPKEAELLPNAFNYSILDPYVDFYIIKTIDYRECSWQLIMESTTTYGDMVISLNALQSVYQNMSKVLLTVQLYSWGDRINENPVMFTYSEVCDMKQSITQKYCKDSLKSLLLKSSLCYTYNMAGVYIKYIDGDDVYNTCQCIDNSDSSQENNLTFVGASVISLGSQWEKENDLTLCENFGDPN